MTESERRCGRRPRLGFIGLGRMGLPMCENLARAGYDVVAGDRRSELADEVAACGARFASTSAEVALAADVLITMLPGSPEVAAVMAGSGDGEPGVIELLRVGSTWLDMSSTSPLLAREIVERARERGVEVLEAPVGGGPPEAAAGTLRLYVGGQLDLLHRHGPILDVLGDPAQILHVGGNGAGYTAKLLANLLWFGQAVATAEALLLGQRAGIDLGTLREALAGSAASSRLIRNDLDALYAGDYMESFGLDRCSEELDSVTALARDLCSPHELSDLVARIHRQALERYGAVNGELLAIALLEEQAGTLLRHPPGD